jgi:hypothetical protein
MTIGVAFDWSVKWMAIIRMVGWCFGPERESRPGEYPFAPPSSEKLKVHKQGVQALELHVRFMVGRRMMKRQIQAQGGRGMSSVHLAFCSGSVQAMVATPSSGFGSLLGSSALRRVMDDQLNVPQFEFALKLECRGPLVD